MGKKTRFFLFLMTLHSALLVTSTVAGAKIFALPFGRSGSATVMSYMATFIILDTIAELYGRHYSRFVINLGLLAMAMSATYFALAIWLPPANGWHGQTAFESVLGSSWRIWLAGWGAYIVSQNLDLWSFLTLKQMQRVRISLSARAWLSMVLAQLIDTVIFVSIAFYGIVPLGPLIVGQYVVKIVIATAGTPLVAFAVVVGRKYIGDRGQAELIPDRS